MFNTKIKKKSLRHIRNIKTYWIVGVISGDIEFSGRGNLVISLKLLVTLQIVCRRSVLRRKMQKYLCMDAIHNILNCNVYINL